MNASPYWFSDFNQTLVFSVFLHFLFLIFLMYIPRPFPVPKREIIPLTVSLIPAPQSKLVSLSPAPPAIEREINPKKLTKKPEVKIPPLKEIVIKPIEVASLPPMIIPKARETNKIKTLLLDSNTGQKILTQLDQLTGESQPIGESNLLVKALNQLAMLTPELRPKPEIEKKETWEETFKELDKIKKSKAELEEPQNFFTPLAEELENSLKELDALGKNELSPKLENKVIAPNSENVFSEIKKLREQKINSQENPIESIDMAKKIDKLDTEEISKVSETLNFENLDSDIKSIVETPQKNYKDILSDLDKMAKLDPISEEETVIRSQPGSEEKVPTSTPIETGSALESVRRSIKKLEPVKNMSIEVSRSLIKVKQFKSKVEAPTDAFQLATAQPLNLTKKDSSSIQETDNENEDILSQYRSLIGGKIYSNWEIPLGRVIRKKIIVSFSIFPLGTISKPLLVKGSGDEKLDALAIKAIFESGPFPPFPKELKESIMEFTINFKLEVQ